MITPRTVFPTVVRVRADAAIIHEEEAQWPARLLPGLRGDDPTIFPCDAKGAPPLSWKRPSRGSIVAG
jgi:hypothetical protein